MNAVCEVLHLVRNDLKRFRSGIAAFALLVAVAAAHAVFVLPVEGMPLDGTFFDALPFLIFLAGQVLAASIVQADPPTRFDAFWATKPMSPAAMCTAKIMTIALSIVAVAAAGQFIAFLSLGIRIGAAIPAVGLAISVIVTGLLIGSLLAAITRDLRTFLVAAVVLLVLVVPFSGSAGTRLFHGIIGVDTVRTVTRALILTAATTLFWLYRTRTDGWRAKMFVSIVALGTMFFYLQGAIASRAFASEAKSRPADRRATVSAAILGDTISVDWIVPSAPRQGRLVLVNPRVTLAFADGTNVVVSYYLPRSKLPFNATEPRPVADGGAAANTHSVLHMSFPLLDTIVRRLRRETASLVIDGSVVEQAAVTLANMPMEPGANVDVDAVRVTFRRIHDTASVQRIEVEAVSRFLSDDGEGTPSELLRPADGGWTTPYGIPAFFARMLTYAAIGSAAQDTLPLHATQFSAVAVPLVLPPSDLYWHHTVLVADKLTPYDAREPRLPANPRLVITGWKYRSHTVVHERIPLRTSAPLERRAAPATPR